MLLALQRTPITVQEPGCGARVNGLLHTESEERRPVLWGELKADGAVDH